MRGPGSVNRSTGAPFSRLGRPTSERFCVNPLMRFLSRLMASISDFVSRSDIDQVSGFVGRESL
jgi:hypothetical protein